METTQNQITSATPANASQTALPELYNPMTAAQWSWILSPVFGAFCLQKNWQDMDCQNHARRARYWLIGLAIYTAMLLLRTDHAGLLFLGNFIALVVKVNDFQIAGYLAANQAERIRQIGKPRLNLNFGGQAHPPLIPFANRWPFLRFERRKHGQPGG